MNALSLFPSWFLFAFGGTLLYVSGIPSNGGGTNRIVSLHLLGCLVLFCSVLNVIQLLHLATRRSLEQTMSGSQKRGVVAFSAGMALLLAAAYLYGPAARMAPQGLREFLAGQSAAPADAALRLPYLWLAWAAAAALIPFGLSRFASSRVTMALAAALGVLCLYPAISVLGHFAVRACLRN